MISVKMGEKKLYHNPDIYRIYVPLPDNPLKYLNCYVLVSDGETLIIDTGFNRPECKQALFDGLDELQVDFAHTKLFDHKGLPFFIYALYNYAKYRYWNCRNRGSVNIICSCDWLLSSEL